MLLGPAGGAGRPGQFSLQTSTVDCYPQYEVLTDDCGLCVWDKTFGLTPTRTTHTTYFVPLVIYEVGAAPTSLTATWKLNILTDTSRFICPTEMKTSSRRRSLRQSYFSTCLSRRICWKTPGLESRPCISATFRSRTRRTLTRTMCL